MFALDDRKVGGRLELLNASSQLNDETSRGSGLLHIFLLENEDFFYHHMLRIHESRVIVEKL